MGLKKFNAKKEIKKLKRRSNKLKKVGVIGAIIGTIFIISSYALYSYTGSSVAFNSQVNKRVKTKLETFADKILSNNVVKTTTPNFAIGEPPSSDSNTGSGLYKAFDDQGESYYFRGDKNKINNNVRFAGMDWKIVRINGDGTIRLILANPLATESKFNSNGSVGFTYNNTSSCTKEKPCEVTYSNKTFSNSNFGGTNSDIKNTLETWYKNNLNSVNDKIAQGYYCNDSSYGYEINSSVYGYGAASRLKSIQPNLQCPNPKDKSGNLNNYGGIYKTKIGLLTIDEISMGGIAISGFTTSENYLYFDDHWWSMSPSASDEDVYYQNEGMVDSSSNGVKYDDRVYPVININANLNALGNGTSSNPFVVN